MNKKCYHDSTSSLTVGYSTCLLLLLLFLDDNGIGVSAVNSWFDLRLMDDELVDGEADCDEADRDEADGGEVIDGLLISRSRDVTLS